MPKKDAVSSKTGRFVTDEPADANPDTTFRRPRRFKNREIVHRQVVDLPEPTIEELALEDELTPSGKNEQEWNRCSP